MPRHLHVDRTGNSDPVELKQNAEDYLILMRTAFNRKMYSLVAHMGHIAVELAFKAAYAKQFKNYHPHGHILKEIVDFEFAGPGVTFFDELTSDSAVLNHYNAIKTAWRM